MDLELLKISSSEFILASELEEEKAKSLKAGEQYTFSTRKIRNPAFHKKVFSFFNFCFQYWKGGHEFQDEAKQFDSFRKDLTILAGFFHEVWSIDGKSLKVEASSLSYGSMSQEEFESLYSALINAALTHIFKGVDDITYERLLEFF